MCGIVGVIAKSKSGLFKGQIDLFQQIFLVDQIRGMDGAGIITDTFDGIEITKTPFGAGSFMHQQQFKDAMTKAVKEGHFIIGHNRAATKGEHTWVNTHPFKEGNISLVHNGTLFDHKNLDKDVVVDSHAIAKHMSKNGAEATLKEIDGAFALAWVNEEEWTINLARNTQRPLHLIETANCWIISSELGLGLWMAERHKMTVVSSFELEKELLYTFDIDDCSKFTTKEVEYHKWIPPTTFKGQCGVNYGSWQFGEDGVTNYDDNAITPATTSFESRRQQHLSKRKKEKAEKAAAAQAAKQNVVAFPSTVQKEAIPPTRAFGTRIQFRPGWLSGQSYASAVLHDNNKGKNFLLGAVPHEPNTEVRVYGVYSALYDWAKCSMLEGTISLTSIHGKKTTYTVENVKIINRVETAADVLGFSQENIEQKRAKKQTPEDAFATGNMSLADAVEARKAAAQEAALIKYCNSKGIPNEPNATIQCDCCSSPVLRKEITMLAGKPLCDTCHTAFSTQPELAKEMGYV